MCFWKFHFSSSLDLSERERKSLPTPTIMCFWRGWANTTSVKRACLDATLMICNVIVLHFCLLVDILNHTAKNLVDVVG